MAPITARQLFVLNLPAIAILLSYFWYKRKRIGAPSDPGDKETPVETDASLETKNRASVPLDIEPRSPQRSSTSSSLEETPCRVRSNPEGPNSSEISPNKSFSRSFSAPIPIVLPKERRLSKTLNISDEELDQQIEKLKSVKKADPFSLISQARSTNNSCSISPIYVKDLSSSVEDKTGENNNLEKISPSKIEIVEETEETVSPCEEVVEVIDPLSNQEAVGQSTEDTEEVTPTEAPEETLSPCEEVVEEITSTNNQDAEEIVRPTEETTVEKPNNQEAVQKEDIVEETDSSSAQTEPSCIEMTSTSNTEIVQNSSSPKVEEVKEMAPSVCKDLKSEETATDCNQVETNQDEDVLPSSAENSVSTDDINGASARSQDPSPSTSTGAVPKQLKKKKFRKLECDLKDLGNKLKETKIGHSSNVPQRRRHGQKSRSDSGCEREETHGHSSGRESANVSPSDTMMAACGSLDSLNSSEGSNDSGKGCSDTTTPPPQPNTFYEFLMPVDKVGKLIGKKGCFITRVYTETNAHIVVRDHPYDRLKKICIVEGTEEAIHKAMAMVKQRFPREKLKPFIASNAQQPAENYVNLMHVPLPAGVNTETLITSIVAPNHIFMQQPFNPTFPNFVQIHNEMQKHYLSDDAPLVPKPVVENTLCVAAMTNGWSRVMILSADQENEVAYVRCMDYGGYDYVPFNQLKQIRQNFFYLPFQAVECFLANVEPIEEEWPAEAFELIRSLTTGFYVFTHIVDFTPENIPLVNCQVISSDQHAVWINEMLVAHGFARWSTNQTQESVAEGGETC